ncbi:MAG: GUN4 domain-containing protein, partial [Planktothrix sp.]|uniref:GUN4 domain-containing protein n=1 Tax=Planktothrix sp. TaxID=3088171 RepID=UPI0038D42A1C
WQDANQETFTLIYKMANQKKGFLEQKSIYLLPCMDLCTIDQLWISASQEHFGFSIQAQILEKIMNDPNIDSQWYNEHLGVKIGWRKPGNRGGWLRYSDLTFARSAPMGHLPCWMSEGEQWKNNNLYSEIGKIFCFLEKFEHCDYLGLCEQNRYQKVWMKNRFSTSV